MGINDGLVFGARLIFLWLFFLAKAAGTADESQAELRADAIRPGCSVSLLKQFAPIREDSLSDPPFDVSMKWLCRDGETAVIDRYEINGAAPEVVSVLYWKKRDIVTLVKWSINSQASDYVGDYYRVFAYRYTGAGRGAKFVQNETLMRGFPVGWDGRSKAGERMRYPFKDAASIRERLQRIDIDRCPGRNQAHC